MVDEVDLGRIEHAKNLNHARTSTGAQAGDHVISDKNLHNVTNVATTATTLADFITSLALTPGNTTFVGTGAHGPKHG